MSVVTVACATTSIFLAYIPGVMKNISLIKAVGKQLENGSSSASSDSSTPLTGTKETKGSTAEAGSVVNLNPRAMYEQTVKSGNVNDPNSPEAYMSRCMGAHNNQMECLPWFFASLLFGIFFQVPQKNIDAVALTYVIARVLYIYFYAFGTTRAKAGGRSLCWMVCVVACVYLLAHACSLAPSPSY